MEFNMLWNWDNLLQDVELSQEIFHIKLYRRSSPNMMTSSNGTYSALLAIGAGNLPVTGKFPAQRPVTGSFDVSLICVWTDSWANNGTAGDLRRYRAHYDVIVMTTAWMQHLVEENSSSILQPTFAIGHDKSQFGLHRCNISIQTNNVLLLVGHLVQLYSN